MRARARERPDVATGADLGRLDHAVREHLRVVADRRVADQRVRPDVHAVAELHPTLEHHVHVDEHVAPRLQRAAHVDARRIGERDASLHQRARPQAPVLRLDLRELHAVVDAEHLGDRRRHQRLDRHLRRDRHLDDVGQVVLALRVRVAQLPEPLAQQARRHRHHARVALADRELRGTRVLLLDDLQHPPARVAHDAPVAGGIRELDRRAGSSPAAPRARPAARASRAGSAARRRRGSAPGDRRPPTASPASPHGPCRAARPAAPSRPRRPRTRPAPGRRRARRPLRSPPAAATAQSRSHGRATAGRRAAAAPSGGPSSSAYPGPRPGSRSTVSRAAVSVPETMRIGILAGAARCHWPQVATQCGCARVGRHRQGR